MLNKYVRPLFLILIICVASFTLLAQSDTTATANGFMRSNDKIYVVMAVGMVILIGLLFYIIRIDRKVSQLEKK